MLHNALVRVGRRVPLRPKKTILVNEIKFEANNGEDIKVDALSFKVSIEK